MGSTDSRANIVAVLGGERSTGLESGCCDAILLRMVYHHFTEPEPMRASLLDALRPGGRIAVIDIVPQTGWGRLDGVPDRGGHGIEVEDVVAEMLGAGFLLEAVYPDWRSGDEDRYCVVFKQPRRGSRSPVTPSRPLARAATKALGARRMRGGEKEQRRPSNGPWQPT